MTQENNKMRKRDEKINSGCKKTECCKRRVFCSSTEFEGPALFSTVGARFPAVFSEVAHCRVVILYLNKHNTVN